jgi:lipoyl(octanoyl) transferase
MEQDTVFINLGSKDYKETWDFQEECFEKVLDIKNQRKEQPEIKPLNYLLFCEHPHVYTLGKRGEEKNLLLDYIQLQAKDASFYKINRGGDITYHGPGQIVGYPILDLESLGLGLKSYIHKMEEAIIQCLADYSIIAERLDGATGVWIDKDIPGKARKICAIGVRASHFVTMHGFAFNVNTDLSYFSHINPCGFTDKGVTSMEKELGAKQNIEEVQEKLKTYLSKALALKIIKNNG